MLDFKSKLDAPTARLLRRKYWIFAVEIGEVRYALDNLVYTTHFKSKCVEYVQTCPYSEMMILNRKTGQMWAFKNGQLLWREPSLLSRIERNQREFETISNKQNSMDEAPFEF